MADEPFPGQTGYLFQCPGFPEQVRRAWNCHQSRLGTQLGHRRAIELDDGWVAFSDNEQCRCGHQAEEPGSHTANG